MARPYAPYASLAELLAAAGVPLDQVTAHTTAELLRRAGLRGKPLVEVPAIVPVAPAPRRKSTDPEGERLYWIQTIRLPLALKQAIDAKAKSHGTTLNGVANRLFSQWVEQ